MEPNGGASSSLLSLYPKGVLNESGRGGMESGVGRGERDGQASRLAVPSHPSIEIQTSEKLNDLVGCEGR
jgi:hypothetical protein